MQNRFEIGDRVKVVSEQFEKDKDLIGCKGVVVGISGTGNLMDVDLGIDTTGRTNSIKVWDRWTGMRYWARELVLDYSGYINDLLKKHYAS